MSKYWYELVRSDGVVLWSGRSLKQGKIQKLIHGGTLYECWYA